MDLSPRLRFQENKSFVSDHKELVVSDRFRAASEAALVQMVMALPEATDTTLASANWHRMEGARTYLKLLLNVAESPPVPVSKPTQNLTR